MTRAPGSASTAYLPAEIDRATWGAVFQDVSLWRPVVAALAREHGAPGLSVTRAPLPGSCAVFVADGELVVKLFPPFFAADFVKERFIYDILAGTALPLPALLGAGEYQDRIAWPYLVFELRPGRPIQEVRDQLSGADRGRLGAQLGEWLRALHATPWSSAPELPQDVFAADGSAWQQFLARQARNVLTALRATVVWPDQLFEELGEWLDAFVAAEAGRPLRLLHADLTADHLLLQRADREWQVTAWLDWADAEIGIVDYEWVALWFDFCRRDYAFFAAVMGAYDGDWREQDDFGRRLLAYSFLHRFGVETVTAAWRTDGRPVLRTVDDVVAWLWPYA